jgi:CrcB protein
MPLTLWIAAGGAVGAATRHLVNVGATRLLGHSFPYGTFTVNVLGSLIMGLLIGLMALRWSASQEMRAFLTTGLLGGFTTFSTFSLDFATLMERKAHALAAIYAAGSVGTSLAAVFVGLWMMRWALT